MLVGLSVHPSVSATYFMDEATDIKGLLQIPLWQILALQLWKVDRIQNQRIKLNRSASRWIGEKKQLRGGFDLHFQQDEDILVMRAWKPA